MNPRFFRPSFRGGRVPVVLAEAGGRACQQMQDGLSAPHNCKGRKANTSNLQVVCGLARLDTLLQVATTKSEK